jgi:NADH-quinone oxidoreductase subunit I
MSNEYELADDSRETLIFTKEQLLSSLPAGATPPPHTDEEIAARGINYYGGFAGTPVLTSADRAEREDESSHIQHH